VHWETAPPANSLDRASMKFQRKTTNQPPLTAKIPF
jgi:hypothetical protein